jgi:hypothetical protein
MTIGSLADVSKAYMIRIAIEEISVFIIFLCLILIKGCREIPVSINVYGFF